MKLNLANMLTLFRIAAIPVVVVCFYSDMPHARPIAAIIFGIAAVFVLRRRMPDAPRPYRVPFYPWIPLIFVVGTAVGLSAIIWVKAVRAEDFKPLIGLGISLAGFPVYWIWRRLGKRKVDLGKSGE